MSLLGAGRGQVEPIRDPSKVVTARRVSRRPPVWRVGCSCARFSVDVADALDGLKLWETHAEQAGHEGDFAVIVDA